jgi:hypothetical protein
MGSVWPMTQGSSLLPIYGSFVTTANGEDFFREKIDVLRKLDALSINLTEIVLLLSRLSVIIAG